MLDYRSSRRVPNASPSQRDWVREKRLIIDHTPPAVRRFLLDRRDQWIDARIQARLWAGHVGATPDFVIIGTQKGGTTHLYDLLTQHPEIAPSLTKEVHFFDKNFYKGEHWYRAFFDVPQAGQLSGEASPSYLYHPHAAQRLSTFAPNCKLIVLLRDPVKRAYSHYNHEVRLGYETLPFADALAQEGPRLRGEKTRLFQNEYYPAHNYMHYSYVTRGLYLTQLQQWRRFFAPSQMLVLKSEDFYANTEGIMARVQRFLGVEIRPNSPQLPTHKSFDYAPLSAEIKAHLQHQFAPHNQRLSAYLDRPMW